MQRTLLLSLSLLLSGAGIYAQVYTDDFDGDNTFVGNANYTITDGDGEVTIAFDGGGAEDAGATYMVMVDGSSATVDISGNPVVSIRARTPSFGTEFLVELIDSDGDETNVLALEETDFIPAPGVNSDVFNVDFSEQLGDVDATAIAGIKLIISPALGGVEGTVIVEEIGLGGELEAGLNIAYCDELLGDSAVTAFVTFTPGYENRTDPESGFGTIAGLTTREFTFDDFRYVFRNQQTFDESPVDFDAAGDRIYIKMRSTSPNPALVRLDLVDGSNIIQSQSSPTALVGSEMAIYEFDYTGKYRSDEFTPPCNDNPNACDVDATDIRQLRFIINPNSLVFDGELIIDWISLGASKEPIVEAPLLYTDCFEDGLNEFTGVAGNGYQIVEQDGSLQVTGSGSQGAFEAFVYNLNDRELQMLDTLDITEGTQLFVRARVAEGDPNIILRIDAVNAEGFLTNATGVNNPVTGEFTTQRYEFAGGQDGGFGPGPCVDSGGGPNGTGNCDVDLSAVTQFFFTINPGDANNLFAGTLIIDEISIGRPIRDGECNESNPDDPLGIDSYVDFAAPPTPAFFESLDGGYTATTTDTSYQIIGDGTAVGFQRVRYQFHEGSDSVLVNIAGNGNEVRVRARVLGVDTARFRIDLIDNADLVTTNAGLIETLTNDFQEFVFDFENRFVDGGYGGSSCPVSNNENPCPVDGQRISGFYIYPALRVGSVDPEDQTRGFNSFNGTIEIERIGAAMVSSINAPREVSDVRVMPNPITDQLRVIYDLGVTGDVSVSVYDGIGREVATQRAGLLQAGAYGNTFNLGGLSAGIYQVVLSVDGYVGKTVTVVKQ